MITQPDLPINSITPEDGRLLRTWLGEHGWQTRRQIAAGLGWRERKIRCVAESLGAEVVRGQRGFALTQQVRREDLSDAIQAADAALSQGKSMIRYGLALKRKLHSILR